MMHLMREESDDYESECGNDVVNFDDFVRVFAHFRHPKKDPEQNPMNTREDKLRCNYIYLKLGSFLRD